MYQHCIVLNIYFYFLNKFTKHDTYKKIPLRIPTKSLVTFETTEFCTYHTFWGPPTFSCTVQAYKELFTRIWSSKELIGGPDELGSSSYFLFFHISILPKSSLTSCLRKLNRLVSYFNL